MKHITSCSNAIMNGRNRILFGTSTAIKSLNNAHTKVLLLFNIHATKTSTTKHVTATLK
jgi:hypothetical protein